LVTRIRKNAHRLLRATEKILEGDPLTKAVVDTGKLIWQLRYHVLITLIAEVIRRGLEWLIMFFIGRPPMPRPQLVVLRPAT